MAHSYYTCCVEDRESVALPGPALDYDWITDRLAVGGAIWTRRNMQLLAATGVTHVVNMQMEFNDSQISDGTGVSVLWNPCDDDFLEKPPELFRQGVEFALHAYQEPGSRIYFHCSAGVHRGPMMLLAFLSAQDMSMDEAMALICSKRPSADFPAVYRNSVERFLATYRRLSK